MRLQTKEQRLAYRKAFLPQGAVKIVPKGLDVEFYIHEVGDKFYARCFIGTSAKPLWSYRFKNAADRELAIKRQIEASTASKGYREKAKAERNAPAKIEVGAIFVTCWGYEQTNREFYKVIALNGNLATIVEVGKIDASKGDEGWMTGKVVPSDKVIGEPKKVRVQYGNTFKVDGHYANLWTGNPVSWTGYH